MHKKYAFLLLLALANFTPHFLIAQCEDVTIEGLTNPGPFEVATLTEADGLRYGQLPESVYYLKIGTETIKLLKAN